MNNKQCAFLFPGQGSQYVGMGKDFYENFSVAKATFEEAEDILKENIRDLIFDGPSAELNLTKNCQTAIFVTSIAILRTVKQALPNFSPTYAAGLSLGEYSAIVCAEKASFQELLPVVHARGNLMHEASIEMPGTMAACLGTNAETVQKCIDLHTMKQDVWIANLNCPGQVVISGTIEGIKNISSLLKEEGIKRVIPLDVSGAFHSGLMKSAQDRLAPKIDAIKFQESAIDLIMNVPGEIVHDQESMKRNLLAQLTSPTLWEQSIRVIEETPLFVEVGCGKVLAGLNKRIGVQGETLSIDRISDLEKLEEKYAAFAG